MGPAMSLPTSPWATSSRNRDLRLHRMHFLCDVSVISSGGLGHKRPAIPHHPFRKLCLRALTIGALMPSTCLFSLNNRAISSNLTTIRLISSVWPSPRIAAIHGFAAQVEDLDTGVLIAAPTARIVVK